jgi:hypothetical protein
MSDFYDRQGARIDLMDWARKFEDRKYSVLAQHWVRGWKVSTVWLGLDHGFGMSPAPLIFETMIFAPKDATIGREDWETAGDAFGTTPVDLDQYQERYPTEAAAQAGHDRALAAMVEQLGGDAVTDISGPLVPGSSDSTWDGSLPAEAFDNTQGGDP